MILLCDEDIGTNVPKALHLVRRVHNKKWSYRTISIVQRGWQSWKDPQWLKIAGEKHWLVFSSNKRMLQVPEEVETIITEKVGIVYLTSGAEYTIRITFLKQPIKASLIGRKIFFEIFCAILFHRSSFSSLINLV